MATSFHLVSGTKKGAAFNSLGGDEKSVASKREHQEAALPLSSPAKKKKLEDTSSPALGQGAASGLLSKKEKYEKLLEDVKVLQRKVDLAAKELAQAEEAEEKVMGEDTTAVLNQLELQSRPRIEGFRRQEREIRQKIDAELTPMIIKLRAKIDFQKMIQQSPENVKLEERVKEKLKEEEDLKKTKEALEKKCEEAFEEKRGIESNQDRIIQEAVDKVDQEKQAELQATYSHMVTQIAAVVMSMYKGMRSLAKMSRGCYNATACHAKLGELVKLDTPLCLYSLVVDKVFADETHEVNLTNKEAEACVRGLVESEILAAGTPIQGCDVTSWTRRT